MYLFTHNCYLLLIGGGFPWESLVWGSNSPSLPTVPIPSSTFSVHPCSIWICGTLCVVEVKEDIILCCLSKVEEEGELLQHGQRSSDGTSLLCCLKIDWRWPCCLWLANRWEDCDDNVVGSSLSRKGGTLIK